MTRAPRIVRTARAVTVGAEILSGKIQDSNSYELARALRRLGVELKGIATIPDDTNAIAEAVREARQQADVVFTSGGIGPTHDDKTIHGVALALGRRLHKARGDQLTSRAEPVGSAFPTLIPEGADLVQLGNPRWPTIVVDNVWLLPGVPELFRFKLGFLGEYIVGPCPFLTKSIFLDVDEVEIVSALDGVVSRHPDVEIGSYPTYGERGFRTQITFDARDEALLLLAYNDFAAQVSDRMVADLSSDRM